MKQKYLTTPGKLVYTLLTLMLMTTGLLAQVVNHPLEGNLNDTANNVSATFQEWNNPFPSPNYVATPSGGQGIELAKEQSVLLDDSFRSLIVSDDSFEIEIDFRYTYTGTGSGRKPIYGSKPTGNTSAGLVLNALKSNSTTFNILLGFADGGFTESQFFKVNPTPLATNDEIKISLKIDYQGRSWFFNANGTYNFGFFPEGFDMSAFKNAIQNKPAYIGWQTNHGPDMEFHNMNGTMIIDHFKLHVPARPGDINALRTALQQMTAHIQGTITLSQTQKDDYTNTIIVNHQKNYTSAKTEIDNYLAAFEANFPPLFNNRLQNLGVLSFPHEQRITYFLLQDIFDHEFVVGNMANIAGTKFREGDIYPGPVSDVAPRISNAQVDINASFITDPGFQLVEAEKGVLRPTGYYAAPGELITITVPAAMVNKGIEIVSGAHIREPLITGLQRFQRISKKVEITNTTTQIANPFGGALYFRIPTESNLGWQTVTISGAVKAPYFRMLTGQPQNVSEWITDLNNAYVPWADIESDKMMFTLPTSMVGSQDLTNIMLKWNEMMDLINTVAGRPLNTIRSEYVQADCSGGVGSAGYPKRMHNNTYNNIPFSTYWNPLRILEPDFVETNQGFIFHELGHNMLFPTPTGHVETVVQMYTVPSYHVLSNDLEKSISYAEDETYGRDTGAIAWMITPEFRNNTSMLDEHAKYQVRGGVKWFDIMDLFSWEDLGKLNKFFYDKWTSEGGPPFYNPFVSHTEYIQAATERIGSNMTPLLNFWGMIPTTSQITTYGSYQASCKIYERLLHYKTLVPKTQAEFLPWRDLLLSEVDPYHHAEINDIYNNYDTQKIGDQILAQIDYLMSTYYPNGECNPLQLTFTVNANDTTITIPTDTTNYTYSYYVDWNGDGDYEDANETAPFTGNATHDFGAAGTYTINLEGRFPTIYFNNGGDKNKITSIDNWGGIQWASLRNSFYGCTNLTISDQAGSPGLTNVTSMLRAFRATAINATGNLNDWDVSNVRDFRAMFRDATAFDQELGNWDISSATAMNNMFNGVTVSTLNYDKTLAGWATLNTGETQIPTGINFHGGNSRFCTSEPERTQLMATGGAGGYNWTITDGNILECGIKVSPVIYLQGPITNPKTGEETLMRDDLRIGGMIPLTSPYADALTTNNAVLTTTGPNAILDWIWIELRDANDASIIIEGKSALLQRDGDIVSHQDGISPLEFTQSSASYYIAITHRNHLSVRTAITYSLSASNTVMNLSVNNTALQGGSNAVIDMGNSIFAIPVGDQDENGQVQNADINAVILELGGSGYNKADMDMNGQIQNTDVNTLMNPNIGKGEQF